MRPGEREGGNAPGIAPAMNADTIVAIATPSGIGGIGVVRLSGPESRHIAERMMMAGDGAERLADRRAQFCRLRDPESGREFDQAVVTFFQAPRSFTGEHVVEFSCHGSMPILQHLVRTCVSLGARPATRGEFSLRAVLNGRMDLTQAEAINRLINARTFLQAEQAVRQLEGEVAVQVRALEERLFDVMAVMEAEVDFAEENESFLHREVAAGAVADLAGELADLVAHFHHANLLREGAVVVLAGRPNAGKSTLFNALLNEERSIVDALPGTTRDYIAEVLEIDGIPVRLIDTAGLRGAGEGVEIEGMRRSRDQIERADMVILVTIAGEALHDDEAMIVQTLAGRGTPCMIARNKIDRLQGEDTGEGIPISARQGIGLETLRREMARILGLDEIGRDRGLVTELRQQQLFHLAADRIAAATERFDEGAPDEVILEELNGAMAALGEITGRGGTEEILSRIFSQFCIGK